MTLPLNFRKLSATERRKALLEALHLADADFPQTLSDSLAETLVEQAFGWHGLPLGLVTGLPVNGRLWNLPLATEEPSVVAAATHAARILARSSGILTRAGLPVTRGQLFLQDASLEHWPRVKESLFDEAKKPLASMQARGGGLRDMRAELLPETKLVLLTLMVDVRDSQGANLVNTVLEYISPLAERLLGGRRLMAILSNSCPERLVGANFSLPFASLTRPGIPGEEMARRIELASEVAQENVDRAVTHNKGILNGITALALATGNDTRALEAGAHAWAARKGGYRPLSEFCRSETGLNGKLEVPLAMATVGGATATLPSAVVARKIIGTEDASELAQVAAALGLAQNFAALLALCGEGIQRGHMALHQKRLGLE